MTRDDTLRSYSNIHLALERKFPLPSYKYLETAKIDLEYGGFLSPVARYHLHEAVNLKPQSLSQSWQNNHDYIEEAMAITKNPEGNWLDNEEVCMIREEIGEPPLPCCPIYFVTIGKGKSEEIVYIGKTSSNSSRFAGGHSVALKLHSPKYNGYQKLIYQCLIILLDNNKDYLPLEWISPLSEANAILESIESQLIYEFKPEFNIQKKINYCAKHPFHIHIQDGDKLTHFIDEDYFVEPRR